MAAGAAASLTQEAGLLSLCPTREPTSTRPTPPTRQVPPKWGERSARSRLRTSKRDEGAHGISDCRQLASSISTSSTAPSNLGQAPECSFPPSLTPASSPKAIRGHARPTGYSASITAAGATARTAGAQESASITAAGAPARTAGAQASASITATEAPARTAGARASASIIASGAPARTAGAPASASITARGAAARTAGARASASIIARGVTAATAGARACVRIAKWAKALVSRGRA